MLEELLIKNTTREQREKIVRDSLSCGSESCDSCSSCGMYGAGDPFDMYKPPISRGKKSSLKYPGNFRPIICTDKNRPPLYRRAVCYRGRAMRPYRELSQSGRTGTEPPQSKL